MKPELQSLAIYKYAMLLYEEHKAVQAHEHSPELQKVLDDAVRHLHLDVWKVGDKTYVEFVLSKDDIDG